MGPFDNVPPLLLDGDVGGVDPTGQAVLEQAADAVERGAGGSGRDEADQPRSDIAQGWTACERRPWGVSIPSSCGEKGRGELTENALDF